MAKTRTRSQRLREVMERMKRPESFTALVQTKLMAGDRKRLDSFVTYLRNNGVPDATRSSTVRALILEGMEGFDG